MSVIQKPASTSNYSTGRFGSTINLIVLHTMSGFLRGTAAWFQNPAARVSAHYGIGLNGEVNQYVDEADTAWGAGNWNINTRAVQIEFEDNNNPFGIKRTDSQYAAAADLIADICTRHGLEATRDVIKGHNEVSNSHPSCPGNLNIDWQVEATRERLHPVSPASGDVNATIEVTVPVLNARSGPRLSEPVVAHFFQGQATIIGWAKGDEVTIAGKTDDVWLRSQNSHWAAQAGTNGNFGHLPGKLRPTESAHLAASTAYGVVGKRVRNLIKRSNP
jgi:hypothetical protein